jgi:hypothetical protein
LSVDIAKKIADAMSIDVGSVLGIAPETTLLGGGFAEDAEPYVPEPTDPQFPASENVFLYRINTDTVSGLGINPGDVLFVDISAAAVAALKPLAVVIAQHYVDMSATTLVRQFVPPQLLITNATTNAVPLVIDRDDVAIKGVVIGRFSRLLS